MKIAHDLYIQLSRQQKGRAKLYQALFKVHVSHEELGRVSTAPSPTWYWGMTYLKKGLKC